MNRNSQSGALNILLIPFILLSLFFIGALCFGFWAFNSRQGYKYHSDQKASVVAAAAVQQAKSQDAVLYAEAAKNPLRTYLGPSDYGSLNVQYPKTWSAYVAIAASGSNIPLDGYFNLDTVPSIQDQSSVFALRVQVLNQTYDQVLNSYQQFVIAKKLSVSPYALPKLPNIIGVTMTGEVRPNVQGTMVILPLRSETLKIWTESSNSTSDFNKYILPNFVFSP